MLNRIIREHSMPVMIELHDSKDSPTRLATLLSLLSSAANDDCRKCAKEESAGTYVGRGNRQLADLPSNSHPPSTDYTQNAVIQPFTAGIPQDTPVLCMTCSQNGTSESPLLR